MNPTRTIRRWLLPIGFVLALLVIVAGTLAWPLAVEYGLVALMFAAIFGARSAHGERRRS